LIRKRDRLATTVISRTELSSIVLSKTEISTGDLTVSPSETYDSLRRHLDNIRQWSSSVSFADLHGLKLLKDIFINLDAFVIPARLHLDRSERNNIISLDSAIQFWDSHYLILGHPGAGKTTSMKQICSKFWSVDAKPDMFGFPLLIRARELPVNKSTITILIDYMISLLPIQVNISLASQSVLTDDLTSSSTTASVETMTAHMKLTSFLRYLDALCPLIIVDGFDEYPSVHGKDALVGELRFSDCQSAQGETHHHVPYRRIYRSSGRHKGV